MVASSGLSLPPAVWCGGSTLFKLKTGTTQIFSRTGRMTIGRSISKYCSLVFARYLFVITVWCVCLGVLAGASLRSRKLLSQIGLA
jgi:hypothetical protein